MLVVTLYLGGKSCLGPDTCPGIGDSWALWFWVLTMHTDKPLSLSSLVV